MSEAVFDTVRVILFWATGMLALVAVLMIPAAILDFIGEWRRQRGKKPLWRRR